jgi:hypothetical protein
MSSEWPTPTLFLLSQLLFIQVVLQELNKRLQEIHLVQHWKTAQWRTGRKKSPAVSMAEASVKVG